MKIEHDFNESLNIVGQYYDIELSQYSNKGPLVVIKDKKGNDLGRAYLDLQVGNWKISEETNNMKKYTVSEDKEIVLDGKKYLLEAGDKIVVNENTKWPE